MQVTFRKPAPQILEEYRSLKGLALDRIDDALDKTKKPIIAPSSDTSLYNKLSYVQDSDDIQIICDAALWASNFKFRMFCTSDRTHILENKNQLEIDITGHYGRNCLIFIHVQNA